MGITTNRAVNFSNFWVFLLCVLYESLSSQVFFQLGVWAVGTYHPHLIACVSISGLCIAYTKSPDVIQPIHSHDYKACRYSEYPSLGRRMRIRMHMMLHVFLHMSPHARLGRQLQIQVPKVESSNLIANSKLEIVNCKIKFLILT